MMSLSKLASRSLSRDLATSMLVMVFLSMSGTGMFSRSIGFGAVLFSSISVFFLTKRSMSMNSVKGAVWHFLRNRIILQRPMLVEIRLITIGLAEMGALLLPRWGIVRHSMVSMYLWNA